MGIKYVSQKEKDEMMSLFILKLHQNKPENRPDPAIETALLRKYIAFSRQHCFPILTDEAVNEIQKYYVPKYANLIINVTLIIK